MDHGSQKLFSVLLPGLTMLLLAKNKLYSNQQFLFVSTSVPFLALWAGILKGGGREQNAVKSDTNRKPQFSHFEPWDHE